MQTRPDAAIATIAATQHSAFTRAQAHGAGLTNQQLAHRVAVGRLHRPCTSVFVIAGSPPTFKQRAMVACLAVEGAVASHETSAMLRSFEPAPAERVVVTVPEGGSHRSPAEYVHRSVFLPPRHVGDIDGIPTTTVERTIIDLAAVSLRARMFETIDWAIGAKAVTVPDLVDEFNTMARSGRRGSAMLRPLIAARVGDNAVPATVLERAMMQLILGAGLERPIPQWAPPWRSTLIGRVDFCYLDHRLVVEVDGRRWHTRFNDFDNDSLRRQLAASVGWQTLDFTWKQVTKDPIGTVSTLREVLAARAALLCDHRR